MALIDPSRPPAAVIPPIDQIGFAPFPDVQPFSQRTASGYQEQLESLLRYVVKLYVYLVETSEAHVFDENAERLVDAVNDALVAQTADNVDKIEQALAAIANADIQITDPAMLAALTATTSAARTWLDGRYVRKAPAPSGGDDTAVLQALLLEAQSSGGTLQLGPGAYRANLATAQAFIQPKVLGSAMRRTTLTPFDPSKPALVFQGGAGGESGGYFADIEFLPHANGGGVGVALRDVCGIHWDRVRFEQGFGVAISYEVTQQGGFTEFCSGEATIQAGTGLALKYSTVKSGETSFHGSGLTGGVVNYSGPFCVEIQDQCFPYNAPLSATFFTHAENTQLIRNRNTHREVSFFGTLRLEHQAGGYVILGAVGDGHAPVLYVGSLSILNGPVRLGNLKLLDDLEYIGGNTFKNRKAFTTQQAMGNGAISFELALEQGEHALAAVTIIGPNFTYECLASVWRNPFNTGGVVTKLSEALIDNTGGGGSATLSVQNGALVITNAYQTSYVGTVTVTPLGGRVNGNALRQ